MVLRSAVFGGSFELLRWFRRGHERRVSPLPPSLNPFFISIGAGRFVPASDVEPSLDLRRFPFTVFLHRLFSLDTLLCDVPVTGF